MHGSKSLRTARRINVTVLKQLNVTVTQQDALYNGLPWLANFWLYQAAFIHHKSDRVYSHIVIQRIPLYTKNQENYYKATIYQSIFVYIQTTATQCGLSFFSFLQSWQAQSYWWLARVAVPLAS